MKLLSLFVAIQVVFSVTAFANTASVSELTITSYGSRLPGLIYQAAGQGPHPTAIILHGYPGNERNLDVAQSLRAKGWNTVYFNYRGAWGAEGEFSFSNSEQDVSTVINYLSNIDNAKTLNIDPNRLSLVGHSMGGHMAIAGILDNPNINCAVAYDGANIGLREQGLFTNQDNAELWKTYGDSLFMLNGWSGDKAVKEVKDHGARLNLLNRTEKLGERAVMLIPADTEVIPMELHIRPLYEALKKNKGAVVKWQLIKDDHSFSNSRDELIAHTYAFLDEYCSK